MPPRRLAAISLALLTAACSSDLPTAPPSDAIVYVIERGWHTDIGLPVNEISPSLRPLVVAFPGVQVLTFGFGERQFLVGRKTNIATMLKALWPSRSALLVTALRTTPQAAFGAANVVVLSISRANLDLLEASLWQELEQHHPDMHDQGVVVRSSKGTRRADLPSQSALERPDAEPMVLDKGPYPGSVFYAARDTYYGLFTCNTWTAETLRSGGFAMPSTGVLFSGQVMGMARWIAAHRASQPSASPSSASSPAG